jgi:hypothetical protein
MTMKFCESDGFIKGDIVGTDDGDRTKVFRERLEDFVPRRSFQSGALLADFMDGERPGIPREFRSRFDHERGGLDVNGASGSEFPDLPGNLDDPRPIVYIRDGCVL